MRVNPEPISTTLAIIGGVTALLSAGTTTALALKQAADRRQQLRIAQLKKEKQKVKKRVLEVKQRRIKVDQMIADSKAQIAKAKAEAERQTPWVLYAGIGGIALFTLIAVKSKAA